MYIELMFQPTDRVHSRTIRQDTRHGDASCGILERPIDLAGHESPATAMTAGEGSVIFSYPINEITQYF